MGGGWGGGGRICSRYSAIRTSEYGYAMQGWKTGTSLVILNGELSHKRLPSRISYIYIFRIVLTRGSKRCRPVGLTNSGLVYESKCGGRCWGLRGLSQLVQLYTGAQLNSIVPTPYKNNEKRAGSGR
jgi:hypothetical protein